MMIEIGIDSFACRSRFSGDVGLFQRQARRAWDVAP
jgi:hypothetical protein